MPKWNISRVALVGAHGYSGLELARLILKHPQMCLAACFVRESHQELREYLQIEFPSSEAKQVQVLPMEVLEEMACQFDCIFFATPPEVSVHWISRIFSSNSSYLINDFHRIPKIIDLSGAYRLDFTNSKKVYGLTHPLPELLAQAEYGLCPWSKISVQSHLISNPGCFSTSVLVAILPLLKAGLIVPDSLVFDCKSGATGAGKKAQEQYLFAEIDGECFPYRVGKHQHLPEIQRYVLIYAGINIDPIFVTSLLPVRRGIISGIYARLSNNATSYSEADSLADVEQAYRKAYFDYPLVRFGCLGLSEKQDRSLLSLRRVVGSPRVHLSYAVSGSKLHIFSCIDNLLKGAASQAIENWNLSQGLRVDCGLENLEVFL